MWCARKWRLLLNLIDHLPRHSFYREAIALDEEVAALWADRELPAAEQLFSELTPEREILMAIYDRLGLLVNVEVKVSGNKPLTLDPWPRPVSAISRAKADSRSRHHDSLVRRLVPPR